MVVVAGVRTPIYFCSNLLAFAQKLCSAPFVNSSQSHTMANGRSGGELESDRMSAAAVQRVGAGRGWAG